MTDVTGEMIDPRGLAEWFRKRAHRAAELPVLSFEGETWSHTEMQDRIEQLSAVFASFGVGRGDRVAYLGFNHPTHLVCLFACARLGAIFVPVNYRLAALEVKDIIEDADAHTMIVDSDHLALAEATRAGPARRRYISAGGPSEGWEDLTALLRTRTPIPPPVNGLPDDIVLLIYTSGTTGKPKGAMLSNGNIWANNLNWAFSCDLTSYDVTLVTAPLSHTGGLCVVLLPTLMAGGHIVLHRHFDALEFMKTVETYRVTVTFTVPAMMLFTSQHSEFVQRDLSSIRLIVAGGAPVPEPLLRLYNGRGIPISQCYGLTESTSGVTFLEADRAAAKLGSAGRIGLLSEVRLIDERGSVITEPNVAGEVCVRGENVIKSYWRLPELTAQAIDAEGWFHSGDVAYVDAEGFYYICDRVKDMIISGGFNVYSAEVESVLYDHPAVAEIAVIGAPDERWGERVVAVVALKPGAALTLEDIHQFAEDKLARYKQPRELHLVDAMPRNPNGKVLKPALREKFGAGGIAR